jgi:hypothetical protein
MSKRTYFFLFILMVIFITFMTVIHKEVKKDTLIETKLGKVVGVTVNRLGKEVNCYFGVPYAEPPIEELRFNKPKPKKPWKGQNILCLRIY